MRFRLGLISLLAALAISPPAQAQSRDSALVVRTRAVLDSVRRQDFPILDAWCKLTSTTKTRKAMCPRLEGRVARVDSLLAAFWPRVSTPPVVPPKPDTTVVKPDTTPTKPPVTPDTTPTQPPPVVITPGPPPSGVMFSHPFAPPANGAVLPTLPQDTVDISYPTITRRYTCTNLQACLDTAQTGDEVLLAKGASFSNVTVKPTSRAVWMTVRTAGVTDADLGGPWERMTPTKADALNLATILSPGTSTPAITVSSGAHHVRFVGIRVKTNAPMTNALIRVGLGETDPALLPHHIVLDRVVVDPGSNDLRRCVVFDGAYLAVVSSTLANCHSSPTNGGGDSQGVLSINGKGPLRIENNTIQAGHQSVFLGGGDPSIRGQVPSDVVIRRNDLSRPLSWKNVWQVKTDLEFKIGQRILVEGNVLCHTWKDAQAGYAILAKTENQDGGTWGDWSVTSDLTIRYNQICGASGGINLAPLPAGPGTPMSRVAIYGNVADSIGVGPYQGDTGDCILDQGIADLFVANNWCRNPIGRSAVYFAGVSPRFVLTGNTLGGQYGLRFENGTAATLTPSGIYGGNGLVSWGTAFGSWPAIVSDSTRNALLNGVVVAP